MNLKHFAQTRLQAQKQDKKKRLLEEVLSQGGKDRKKAPSKVNTSRKKAVRKVNLGWFHFHESTQTHVQVKSQKGGGTRVADLPVLSARDVIISTGINWFFFSMDPAPLAPQMRWNSQFLIFRNKKSLTLTISH